VGPARRFGVYERIAGLKEKLGAGYKEAPGCGGEAYLRTGIPLRSFRRWESVRRAPSTQARAASGSAPAHELMA